HVAAYLLAVVELAVENFPYPHGGNFRAAAPHLYELLNLFGISVRLLRPAEGHGISLFFDWFYYLQPQFQSVQFPPERSLEPAGGVRVHPRSAVAPGVSFGPTEVARNGRRRGQRIAL